MRIDIPAGALSADTAAQRHRARAARPRLPPDPRRHPVRQAGQTDLHTDQDVEGSAPQPLSIASQDKTGVWQMYRKPVRDLTARTVSVETNSGWSVGRREGCLSTRGAIQTNALRSKVRGRALRAVYCSAPSQDENGLFVPLPGAPPAGVAAP
ncbi:hypothetical protein SAMN00790413_06051 [Deinococcus hopiensis KR-140]|uniref:Uncharacterized protein n=1 Tax=Deinococcus hopiensis KR-140 TaxID=695939 RepID=A0A1W1VW48_9DEIO|nr:hypothetical protein SAMN00790413_06051 [Deinococcus hopiensis KR-140]